MHRFHLITLTHQETSLDTVGELVLDQNDRWETLSTLKEQFPIDELLYVGTCNRVAFLLVTENLIDQKFIRQWLESCHPDWSHSKMEAVREKLQVWHGEDAIRHLFRVASSLESMVVGEREIQRQLQAAYDSCKEAGLTGDSIRLAMEETVRTAKDVYTNTRIGEKPVSVVSIAFRRLEQYSINKDAPTVMVGAGDTNQVMSKFLAKNDYRNVTVFNRSIDNARDIAQRFGTTPRSLDELSGRQPSFKVLITCTGATDPVITESLFESLHQQNDYHPIIIDLGVPKDIDRSAVEQHDVTYIDIDELRDIAENNHDFRKQQLEEADQIIAEHLQTFEQLLEERKVETALRDIPKEVKEVRQRARDIVFSKEIESLDEESKEVVDKVLAYMEKKCISIPMKTAKKALLE